MPKATSLVKHQFQARWGQQEGTEDVVCAEDFGVEFSYHNWLLSVLWWFLYSSVLFHWRVRTYKPQTTLTKRRKCISSNHWKVQVKASKLFSNEISSISQFCSVCVGTTTVGHLLPPNEQRIVMGTGKRGPTSLLYSKRNQREKDNCLPFLCLFLHYECFSLLISNHPKPKNLSSFTTHEDSPDYPTMR